ncbi:MAG: alpha/beta fold hydrolase [Pseudomonadota bacterium]
MRRGYLDTDHGQLHYYDWRPPEPEAHSGTVWVGLASMPYSGLFFETVAAHRPAGAQLIGVDLPGYGQSDPLPQAPTIEDYARSVAALLAELAVPRIELVGFHTGCLVALGLAQMLPMRITRLNLIDAPAFDAATRAKHLENTPPEREIGSTLESIEPIFNFNIARHGDRLPVERGLALMVEDLKSGRGQPLGFRAAFGYDALAQAAAVTQPVRLVGTDSPLLDPTRALAAALPDAQFEHWADAGSPVFEQSAARIASWLFG